MLPASSHPCATTAHHNGQARMRDQLLSAQHRRASEAAAAQTTADDAGGDAVGGRVYDTHLKKSARWARPLQIHSSNRVLRVRGEEERKKKKKEPQPSLGRSAREVKGAFTLVAHAALSSLFLPTPGRESESGFFFSSFFFFKLNFLYDYKGFWARFPLMSRVNSRR